jgi:hypothetical protein
MPSAKQTSVASQVAAAGLIASNESIIAELPPQYTFEFGADFICENHEPPSNAL